MSFIEAIAEKVKKGECILFLGAGVHYGPPEGSEYEYPPEQRPALGGTLARSLAAQCDFAAKFPRDSPSNLQRVSLCFEIEKKSRQRLVDEIKAAVHTGKQPSPVVRALAELPFPLVITTNYDRLFETALTKYADKSPVVGVYDPDEYAVTSDHRSPTAEEPFVYKIHGDIQQPESLVVTDEDYIHFILRMSDKDRHHPVPETFRFNFKRWPTLFVGYSLMDYNLRLLFQTLRWKMDRGGFPSTYSVDPYPDQLILSVWQDQRQYVTFIPEDVWKFVPELYLKVTGREMPGKPTRGGTPG